MDLDETLVHCFNNAEQERLCTGFNQYSNGEIFKFTLPDPHSGRERKFTVVLRPGAIKLMQDLQDYFEIHVWTAATQAYADKILDWIEEDTPNLFHPSRGYRHDCTAVRSPDGEIFYVKDIAQKCGGMLDRVLLLDNNPRSSPEDQVLNSVPVVDFFGSKDDDEFVGEDRYKKILIEASKLPDVRCGISDNFRRLIRNRRSGSRVSEITGFIALLHWLVESNSFSN